MASHKKIWKDLISGLLDDMDEQQFVQFSKDITKPRGVFVLALSNDSEPPDAEDMTNTLYTATTEVAEAHKAIDAYAKGLRPVELLTHGISFGTR